jgi:hypothetical protein
MTCLPRQRATVAYFVDVLARVSPRYVRRVKQLNGSPETDNSRALSVRIGHGSLELLLPAGAYEITR